MSWSWRQYTLHPRLHFSDDVVCPKQVLLGSGDAECIKRLVKLTRFWLQAFRLFLKSSSFFRSAAMACFIAAWKSLICCVRLSCRADKSSNCLRRNRFSFSISPIVEFPIATCKTPPMSTCRTRTRLETTLSVRVKSLIFKRTKSSFFRYEFFAFDIRFNIVHL